MTFSLRIPGDGSGAPSVSSSAQVLDNTHLSWRMGLPAHPKPTEFTVMPCRGTIRAQGTQDVQVWSMLLQEGLALLLLES